MKKLLFAAAAVFAFGMANAQEDTKSFGFNEGDIILEGNLGFSSTNDKNSEEKTSSFNFNPKVGYFLTNDIAVGVELGIGSAKSTDDILDTEDKGSNFNVGVFGRYYFLNLGERFKTYTEAGLGFGTQKSEFTAGGVTTEDPDFKSINAGLGLGVNYFVTEKIAINFALTDILSYSSGKYDVSGAKNVSSFNGNVNVFNNFFTTAQFGMTFKL